MLLSACSDCFLPFHPTPPHPSFSTDDDNDTEVEAIDVDTELNLVTECWVEPQSGTVLSTLEQQRHLLGLTYQEIPQAVSNDALPVQLFIQNIL